MEQSVPSYQLPNDMENLKFRKLFDSNLGKINTIAMANAGIAMEVSHIFAPQYFPIAASFGYASGLIIGGVVVGSGYFEETKRVYNFGIDK